METKRADLVEIGPLPFNLRALDYGTQSPLFQMCKSVRP
jgi:hypothetical protein